MNLNSYENKFFTLFSILFRVLGRDNGLEDWAHAFKKEVLAGNNCLVFCKMCTTRAMVVWLCCRGG